jgi:hypothetical protein
VPGQPSKLHGRDPLDREVLEQLGVGHADAPPLPYGEPVGLDLRGGVDVAQLRVEQPFAAPELPDVGELVHHVEVDGAEVALLQMMGADQQVTVNIARAHVAEPRGEELDLEIAEHLRGLVPEQLAHRRVPLESTEEPREREQADRNLSLNANVEPRLRGHAPTEGPRLKAPCPSAGSDRSSSDGRFRINFARMSNRATDNPGSPALDYFYPPRPPGSGESRRCSGGRDASAEAWRSTS